MQNIIIRNAAPCDAKAITEFGNMMWKKTYSHIFLVEDIEKRSTRKILEIPKLEKQITENNSLNFVVERNGKIVGTAFASAKNFEGMGDDVAQLVGLYLRDDVQGIGIALELAKIIVKKFLELGFTKMVTGCLADNKFNAAHIALGGKRIKQVFKENHGMENIYFFDDIGKIVKMTMHDAAENIKKCKNRRFS
jgi:predicted N-acetyltransferase YhbS